MNILVRDSELYKIASDPRQVAAAKEIARAIRTGNGKSQSEILASVGYSRSVSHIKPSTVIQKPTFQQLLDKLLPIEKVVSRHADLVDSENENIAVKSTELAYRVHGKLKSDEPIAGASLLAIFSQPQTQQQLNDPDVIDVEVSYADTPSEQEANTKTS